ncbi:hypothetical protein Taro_031909 [Colocasia esculenta]|uniref:Uncharacterized protein n=1 Tax=Colocasia esculenta TaxID=4460 RepID=A0A843VR93_COLES|nr:hypothetical protein [Colocasia esculenta]
MPEGGFPLAPQPPLPPALYLLCFYWLPLAVWMTVCACALTCTCTPLLLAPCYTDDRGVLTMATVGGASRWLCNGWCWGEGEWRVLRQAGGESTMAGGAEAQEQGMGRKS